MRYALLAAAWMVLAHPAQAHDHAHGKHRAESDGIAAIHAWANATSGGEALVFVDIENQTAAQVDVIGGESAIAEAVELVALANLGGKLDYEIIPRLPVPASGSIQLAPNGVALRLLGLTEPLKEGSSFEMELVFGDAHLDITVAVEPEGATQHSHAGHAH